MLRHLQDQVPRCGLCEGTGGVAYGDRNDEIVLTPCEVVAEAKAVDPETVATLGFQAENGENVENKR